MVEYDQNFQITAAGGDNWIYAHALEGKNYDDANVLLAKIEDYRERIEPGIDRKTR